MKIFQELFGIGVTKPLIGMVHLLPTVGYPEHPGMEQLIAAAVADAQALQAGGAHAVLVENDNDKPHTLLISAAQTECIQAATLAIRESIAIPVGVNIILNDWKAALDIAVATGCRFVRIDVFVDRVSCDAGVIEPEAEKIRDYADSIGGENIALFTDIQVKHKKMLEMDKSLVTSAQQAINAKSDAVIVTGDWTGQETPMQTIVEVKNAFPDFPVLVGAGIRASNIVEQLRVADGAIVGTSLKNANGLVDSARVAELISLIQTL